MNITSALDEKVVKEARKIAIERDTTLTGLIREFLEDLVAQDTLSGRKRREREALERTLAQIHIRVGKRTGNGKTYMPGPEFLDTNILVYTYDISDPEKHCRPGSGIQSSHRRIRNVSPSSDRVCGKATSQDFSSGYP